MRKKPKLLEFLLAWYEDEEDEKKGSFMNSKRTLCHFYRQLGNDNFKVPSIGGRELDLCKLYKVVYVRGGYVQVSNRKLWKEISSMSSRYPVLELVRVSLLEITTTSVFTPMSKN